MLLPMECLRKGSWCSAPSRREESQFERREPQPLHRHWITNSTIKANPSAQGQAHTHSTSDDLKLCLHSNSMLPIFKSVHSVSHPNIKHTRDPLWYLKISSSFRKSTLAYRVSPETTKSMKIHLKHKDKREALNSWVMHVGCQVQKAFNSFRPPEDMYAWYLHQMHTCRCSSSTQPLSTQRKLGLGRVSYGRASNRGLWEHLQ